MSKQAYEDYLKSHLAEIADKIAALDRKHAEGALMEKVEAAAALVKLKEQQEELNRKLAKLQKEPDGFWESVKTEIEEDLDAIRAAIASLAPRL